jgi:hypothetical protein
VVKNWNRGLKGCLTAEIGHSATIIMLYIRFQGAAQDIKVSNVALRGGINWFNMLAVGTKVEHQNKQNISDRLFS